MSSIFSNSASFQLDYSIYNSLIDLLTSQRLTNLCCLDAQTSLILDQPIKLLNYNILSNSSDLDNHTKIQLAYVINKLLKERLEIVELLEKTDLERKVRFSDISLDFP